MERKYILGIVALSMAAILTVSLVSAFGNGFGMGFGNQDLTDEEKAVMDEERQAMQTAIETGDYATWKSLMEQRMAKMQEGINEENFNAFQERHQQMAQIRTAMQEARDSGDFSEVEALREQYGIEKGPGMGKGRMGSRNGECPMAEAAE